MTKLSTALQLILGLGLLFSAISKLTGGVDDMRADLEIASWFWTTIAIIELVGGLALLASVKFRRLALPAAAGGSLFFLGAIGAHLRVGDFSATIISPVVILVLFLTIVAVRWNLFVLPEQGSVTEQG